MNLRVELTQNQLDEAELHEIVLSLTDKELMALCLKQKNLSSADREYLSKEVFSNQITAQINPSNFKLIKAWDEKGGELDTDDLFIELADNEMNQIKALAQIGISEVSIQGNRSKASIFNCALYNPEETIDAPILKKSIGRLVLEKAVLTTVLFAVLGGIGSKAYAGETAPKNKTSINFDFDHDIDKKIQIDRATKLVNQLEGDVNFLTKHLELDKEAEIYKTISNLTKQVVDDPSDLNKDIVKKSVGQLDKNSKLQLENALGDLKDVLGRKLTMQSFIKDKLQAFDTQISNLLNQSDDLDTATFDKLVKLKTNSNVEPLKKVMNEDPSKLQSSYMSSKAFYSHILETPAGSGIPDLPTNTDNAPILAKK